LRRLLESEGDMKVIGEACDGHEAVNLATELKPIFCCWISPCPTIPDWMRFAT